MSTNPGSGFQTRHMLRFGLALIGAASLLATAAEPTRTTPAQQVEALHAAFGDHHSRGVHAKGIILEGTFTPAPEARSLSAATLFSQGTIPITVRFSDFTGIPDIPDTVDDANPRGMAVKFRLANGQEADFVTHSFNGFPVANGDEFAELMRAIGASGAEIRLAPLPRINAGSNTLNLLPQVTLVPERICGETARSECGATPIRQSAGIFCRKRACTVSLKPTNASSFLPNRNCPPTSGFSSAPPKQ